MYRNLSKRIEVVTPIFAPPLKERLWTVLDICLRDQRQAWELNREGTYTQLHPKENAGPDALGTHVRLMELAVQRPR
jgi:polyphosphate kinase